MNITETQNNASVAEIKSAAKGRWPEILSAVGGIDRELLDGKHHPCPKCGGTDRFRAIDIDAGALFCNQCFDTENGDGLSAIGWLRDCDFPTAVSSVADYVGIKPSSNGQGKRKPRGKISKLAENIAKLGAVYPTIHDALLSMYAEAKPPITPKGIKKCGGVPVIWCGQRCIRLDGYTQARKKPAAVVLARVDGRPFPATEHLLERKTHSLGGSINSWLTSGTPEEIKQARTALDVEGTTDFLGAASNLPPGWVVVTNTCGAKARGKLPCEWVGGKQVVVVGDTDEPGQEGIEQSAVAYHKAGATVSIGRLPFSIEETHGKDLRDWLNEGHKLEDLPTEIVTSEQITEWSKATPPTNALSTGAGSVPIQMTEVVKMIFDRTGNWPRQVDGRLFFDDNDHNIRWLDTASSFFGWLAGRCGIVHWQREAGYVTKEETLHEVRRRAVAYKSIEITPHEPLIVDHHYACKIPECGDGKVLNDLFDFFCPATDLDRQLIKAAFATGLWGGPSGMRPAVMFTASTGRGKGKTALAERIAQLYGGSIDVSAKEDIAAVKTRLLSPDALSKRIVTLDNVKTTRFSWADLESLITADTISGKRLYVGDGSRPNYLTVLVTLNGASLSTDMTQRVVEVQLADPLYDGGWDESVRQFIESNRSAILGDLIAFLRQPEKKMRRYSRWGTWEKHVLSRVDDPDSCLDLILQRRSQADAEEEEGHIVEDYFAGRLTSLGYDPNCDDIFIPNRIASQWYNDATGNRSKVTAVTRALKQFYNEAKISRLLQARGHDGSRGFRWVGDHADAGSLISYDICHRIAKQHAEHSTQEEGNSPW